MQENCRDWSNVEEDNLCCIHCSKSLPGCLCHSCKCTKCYWYEYGEDKGSCILPIQNRCPNCGRIMSFHPIDEFARWHCSSAMHFIK
jgi:hypothetical protein